MADQEKDFPSDSCPRSEDTAAMQSGPYNQCIANNELTLLSRNLRRAKGVVDPEQRRNRR